MKKIMSEKEIQENEIKEMKYTEQEYMEGKKQFEEMTKQKDEKNKVFSSLQMEQLKCEYRYKDIEKKEQMYLQDKKDTDQIIDDIRFVASQKEVLSDYILYLLNYLKPKIEDLASEYFTIITDSLYTQLTLDEEYNILIDGKTIELYSGWEKDLANLCLRLSLWQNLTSNKWNPINFLILDEILWSQDKTRQNNILFNLKKLEYKFSQIILISHVDEIKDFATHLIEVRSINNEESEIRYA